MVMDKAEIVSAFSSTVKSLKQEMEMHKKNREGKNQKIKIN